VRRHRCLAVLAEIPGKPMKSTIVAKLDTHAEDLHPLTTPIVLLEARITRHSREMHDQRSVVDYISAQRIFLHCADTAVIRAVLKVRTLPVTRL
jgi:hypothetical protein